MMNDKGFDLKRAVEILERTPRVIREMLDGLSDDWTSGGTKGDWAPVDVVGHLIHGEQTDWIPRAQIILEHGEERTFIPFDRLAQFEFAQGRTLAELIDEFETLRAENVETLRSWNLSESQLQLRGMHPELGKVTLEQLIATWLVHDLTHIRQIATFMARKYEKEVGPWREYLSILH